MKASNSNPDFEMDMQLPSYKRARIDVLVANLGSVIVYEVVKHDLRQRKYMEEYHMDEELEMHLDK